MSPGVKAKNIPWALAVAVLVGMIGVLVPAGVSRQQMAVAGLLLGDGLSAWTLSVLCIHLLLAGPQAVAPWLYLAVAGVVVGALGAHILLTVAGLGLVLIGHVVQHRHEKASGRWYLGYVLGVLGVGTGLYFHLHYQSGSLMQVSPGALQVETWVFVFAGGWALLGLWPFGSLVTCRDCEERSLLRVAVATLLLRTFNLGPWPPTASLAGSAAVAVSLLIEATRDASSLHLRLPSYYLLALLPVAGPLGPAAAMASELIYPLWSWRPAAGGAAGMVMATAWVLSSIVPLWLGTATLHQAGLTAYGALVLLVGLVALGLTPAGPFPAARLCFSILVPLLFPSVWRYIVAPGTDALYQGLTPMFVTADPWTGVYFPSGDLVLTVLPFPAISMTVPALLAIALVVARYVRGLERQR